MKKTLMLMTVAALAAGVACAQNAGDDNAGNPPGKTWGRDGGRGGWNQMDKRGERPSGPVDAETMQKMRAAHEEIRDLAGAARIETDATKKAEIVARLRAKLGEVADLMQVKQEQRLAQAEERLAGLKDRIEYAKTTARRCSTNRSSAFSPAKSPSGPMRSSGSRTPRAAWAAKASAPATKCPHRRKAPMNWPRLLRRPRTCRKTCPRRPRNKSRNAPGPATRRGLLFVWNWAFPAEIIRHTSRP